MASSVTRILIYADQKTRTLTDSSGAGADLPPLVEADKYEFMLRILDTTSGSAQLVTPPVRTVSASIGPYLVPPASGSFTLKFGDTGAESVKILPNHDPTKLAQAIAGLAETSTYGGSPDVYAVSGTQGCWLIWFNHDGAVPLQVGTNRLDPVSFVRVRAFQQGGRWVHELRLLQAPVASTVSNERTLAPEPTVSRVRSGDTTVDGGVTYVTNEVQDLAVSPNFSGTFALKYQGVQTRFLSRSDDETTVAEALNAIVPKSTADDPAFLVTNPTDGHLYIEFSGVLGGAAQDLLQPVMGDAGVGDLTFTLDLETAEVASAVRAGGVANLWMEVILEIGADGEDPANPDPTVPGVPFTLFREQVSVVAKMQWEGMESVSPVDWLRPPQPKRYIPFTRDQIITGSQHYEVSFGDGELTDFTFNHNLGTFALHVTVIENKDNGRMLERGASGDYQVHLPNPNSLTVTMNGGVVPEENSLAIVITSAGPVSAFQAHTHTIAQIDGLQTILDSLTSRVTVLEDTLPTTGLTVASADGSGTISIDLGKMAAVLFYNGAISGAIDASKLPARGAYLLPAIHGPTVLPLPSPMPSPTADSVWSTADSTLIPGGGMIRSSYSKAGGYVGSDGRILYPAIKAGTTGSYYPAPFERLLFEFDVNDQMLAVGKTLDVQFAVDLALFNASCRAQWVLVIEHGIAQDQTTPDNTDPDNLSTVEWNPEPILSQRIILSPVVVSHSFGCRIKRTASGIDCDKAKYGNWSEGDSAPADANFVLRARLIEFDTENNQAAARGWVYYQLGPSESSTSSSGGAVATIS
jgi:hypothetical protein